MSENSIFEGNFFYRGKDVSVTFAQKFGDVLECIHEKEDVSGTKALNEFWESKTWKHMLDLENSFWLKTPEEIYKVYAKEKEEDKQNSKLLAEATLRMQNADLSKTISQEEAMKELGITQADLDEMNDVEIE